MAAMFRALAKPFNVAAAAFGAVAGTVGYNQAQNNCADSMLQAYRKFMPVMDFPDLSNHNNCLKKVLTPQLYAKLRDLVSLFFTYLFFYFINLLSDT